MNEEIRDVTEEDTVLECWDDNKSYAQWSKTQKKSPFRYVGPKVFLCQRLKSTCFLLPHFEDSPLEIFLKPLILAFMAHTKMNFSLSF